MGLVHHLCSLSLTHIHTRRERERLRFQSIIWYISFVIVFSSKKNERQRRGMVDGDDNWRNWGRTAINAKNQNTHILAKQNTH